MPLSAPVDTADAIAFAVCYRARWTIEVFFKALKTGCQFEKRQLESARSRPERLGDLRARRPPR